MRFIKKLMVEIMKPLENVTECGFIVCSTGGRLIKFFPQIVFYFSDILEGNT